MWRGETPKGNGRLVLVEQRMTTARTARRWPSKRANEALQKLRGRDLVICPIVLDRLLCTSRCDTRCRICAALSALAVAVLSSLALSAIRHTSPHFTPAVCLPGRVFCPCSSLASSPPVNHHHHSHPMTIATAIPLPPTPDRNTTRAAADAVPEVTGHAPSVCRDS